MFYSSQVVIARCPNHQNGMTHVGEHITEMIWVMLCLLCVCNKWFSELFGWVHKHVLYEPGGWFNVFFISNSQKLGNMTQFDDLFKQVGEKLLFLP